MDPTELWSRWYETGTKMWSEFARGNRESYMDPYGLYRQWFENLQSARESMLSNAPAARFALPDAGSGASGGAASMGVEAQQKLLQRWFDATAESWQKAADLGNEVAGMTPRWMQMLEQARDNLMNVERYPSDPLEFAVQWYNATSGPFSEFVQDVIEREEFLEPASRSLQSYAKFYKIFRRSSEEYLKTLSVPVRSDISRVAGLVINLEEKVDNLEEAFEDFQDGQAGGADAANAASAEAVSALEERIDRVEGKLDRLLAAVESLGGAATSNGAPAAEANAPAETPQSAEAANGSGDGEEIKATNAARRKAEELGVDLAAVEGSGTDGQITVADVRRKGES
jgi:polyhydroxyalkanoic acid synthase PhaR subunit